MAISAHTDLKELESSKRRHYVVTGLLVLVATTFVLLLLRGLGSDPTKVPSALIGKPAQPFDVSWLQGKELFPGVGQTAIRLSDFKGKPIVLNFWASWCVSCREEAALFQAFWEAHRDRGDVVVIGIAIQDTPEEAMKFAKFFGKTYILGLDQNGKASIDYGVYGVPETFFIDSAGIIKHKEAGPVTTKMLEQKLAELL